MRKFFILSLLSLLLPIATRAQQQWSLEDCICYALNNNLSIKTQALNIASNRLVKDKARLDYLPSMDFNSNYQFSLGRSLDPTTYSFIENSTVNTIGTGLSIGTTLFDGMKRYYAYRKSIADLDIAVADLEMTRNDVSLSVVMAYMNILLNREVMESVERQIEISETNINRTKIMVEEGVMTDDKLQNLLIQYNNEQYSMAEAAGNLRKSIIGLCSLLNIDDYDTFDIKADTSFAIIPAVPLEDVIAAVGGLPQMESARKKIKSAEYAVRITKGDVFPRISFGAAMASSWSDARRRPLLDGAGNAVIIASGLQYRDYPFLSQLNDNRNSYISLSLGMPILGQFQTNKSIALARNNVLIARNEAADTEKRLVEHIYEIYAEIETARNKYKYSVSSAERGKTALEYSAEKLANGMITVSDYMIEKENLLIAEAQASKAKYEYWFKMYLLRFYYTI